MHPHSYTADGRQHPSLPPPPSAHSPLRRAHLPQPPALRTAALVNSTGYASPASAVGTGLTPLSTTSLSTPFSHHSASPYPASPAVQQAGNFVYPASPAVAASPMAFRASPNFAASPYNPQEWARNGGIGSPAMVAAATFSPIHARQTSHQVAYAPRLRGPDEPMVSPPPPYSAEPTTSPDTTSPSTDFSRSTVPSSATASISPTGMVAPVGMDRLPSNAAPLPTGSPVLSSSSFPPPPPAAGQVRSTSRNHADRLLQAMNIRTRASSTVPQPNAIDTLHQNTSQLLQVADADPNDPPGARRAASMSALNNAYIPRQVYSNSPVQDLGIVLPPPPPGPPPPTTRSQSACRPSDALSAGVAPPASLASRARQHVAQASTLGPIPPTPADWQGEPSSPNPSITSERQISHQPLRVETENLVRGQLVQSPASGDLSGHPSGSMSARSGELSANSSGSMSGRPRRDSSGLVRSAAVRNRSAQGLRERRSESRRGVQGGSGDSAGSDAADPLSRPLKDIVTTNEPAGRRASTRVTPKSGQFRGLDEALRSNESERPIVTGSSAHSTPRPESSRQGKMPSNPNSPNTPYSPARGGRLSAQSFRSGGRRSLDAPSSAGERPYSHIFHMPNDESVSIPPLRPESSQSLIDIDDQDSSKTFTKQAMDRYRLFAQQEANASSDSERLHLFTQFMVAESQLRRERYATVFRDEGVKVPDLLEGMFDAGLEEEPSATIQRNDPVSATTRRSSGASFADSGSHSRPMSASSASEPLQLTLDTSVNDPRSKSFVPALSPIASMSAVTGREEMDSRGRAPSRWWEGSESTSHRGEGFDVLQRSKRESKYMSAVLEHEALPSFDEIYRGEGSSTQPPMYGPNEYPPEKVGWHEPPPARTQQPPTPLSAPYTPDPHKLDISRLITLPPPYPRHHPAVNNSHPDLADVRTTVRALNELAAIGEARDAFDFQIQEKRTRSDSWCQHQRSLHDQDVQFRIEHGEITQREYDAAEAALEVRMGQAKKDLAQTTFDLFQEIVVTPVQALVTERLQRADTAFAALSTRLLSDSETHSPNLPQEAGDEKPELLEKLTMLKWLFEAREALHRAKHLLLTQRNEYYKAVVLTPYSLARNAAKLAEAEAFFAADVRKRQAASDAATVHRWTDLLTQLETHVTRGVEVQLSAFWDIAPPLQALLQRIPAKLTGFEILIPRVEVQENPSYWAHPLRYLFSVLAHAEASSRQFVEGQVSLWCLLQEVREGCVGAKWRARASAKLEESRGVNGLQDWDEREKALEVRRGVEDLKEKVGAVEEQWIEGLGGAITGVKDSVRAWLERSGGWDEELESGE